VLQTHLSSVSLDGGFPLYAPRPEAGHEQYKSTGELGDSGRRKASTADALHDTPRYLFLFTTKLFGSNFRITISR
jgi:hypothetical protein